MSLVGDALKGLGDLLTDAWHAIEDYFSDGPTGSPIQQCPLTNTAMPEIKPASCAAAPSEIHLPKAVNKAMKDAYANSFPGGVSQEHGGTIVKSADGTIKVINEGSGTSGTFSPNRATGRGEKLIGIFHTHPYDASEGGSKGVSFSAADMSIAIAEGEADYVDAGTHQFAIMPTGETPAVSHAAMQTEWNAAFAAAAKKGLGFEAATRATALELAKKHKMAYYEGKDGVLKKLSC